MGASREKLEHLKAYILFLNSADIMEITLPPTNLAAGPQRNPHLRGHIRHYHIAVFLETVYLASSEGSVTIKVIISLAGAGGADGVIGASKTGDCKYD
ncbi:hypothetical protein E4U17_005516 [Claviceps sp. LM77 group G4]|nr:hypothetical protein E4U17_005516 [Claviceps sp. LM77 group G4]